MLELISGLPNAATQGENACLKVSERLMEEVRALRLWGVSEAVAGKSISRPSCLVQVACA